MEQTLLLAPLAAAIVAGLGWRLIGETAARWTAATLIVIASALSWVMLLSASEDPGIRYFYTWIEAGSLSAALAFRVDQTAAHLLVLVTSLSVLAHLVTLSRPVTEGDGSGANRYVDGQEARLVAGLGLMTAAVVLLIVADDLAQFLAGWIATGVASSVLCGNAARRPAAGKAALRLALTCRGGEAVLFLVVGLVFALTDTIRFDDLFQALPDLEQTRLHAFGGEWSAPALIAAFVGLASLVMAAQAIFFGWLSDSAEASMPGAVLILTAGPVVAASTLLFRMGPVLELAPLTAFWLVTAAMATTVIAATSAIVQKDPMHVIACLASAQAGFVLTALGLGAAEAAMVHLLFTMTALAALALAVGVAAGSGDTVRELDRLGARGRVLPLLLATAALAAASLSALGLPGRTFGLSGFLSYGAVFDALAAGPAPDLLWVGALALVFCSLAAWRLVLRVFVFPPQAPTPAPDLSVWMRVISVPLFGLALVSAALGSLLSPSQPPSAGLILVLAGLTGLGLATAGTVGLFKKLKEAMPWMSNLLLNGWFIAAVLRMLVTSPLAWASAALARWQNREAAQKAQVGALRLVPVLAQQASRLQGGLTAGYGVAVGIAVAILILWIVLRAGVS